MSAEIRSLGDPDTHFWMTRSVARVMGVNLSRALDMGVLSAGDYAEMVRTCRTCPRVAQCQRWLGQPRHDSGESPRHCLNCRRLERIAAQLPC